MFGRLCTFDTQPPTYSINGLVFNGQYIIVNTYTAPYAVIYKRNGHSFTQLPPLAEPPSGNTPGCALSTNGIYLAFTQQTYPYINIYKRSGDVFTRLPNPSTLPNAGTGKCDFSEDGQYLVITSSASPYLHVYKREGDVFTKLANPTGTIGGGLEDCSISADGVYIAARGTWNQSVASPVVFKRTGDIYAKLSSVNGTSTTNRRAFKLSGDAACLIGSNQSDDAPIWSRSGDTFTNTQFILGPTPIGIDLSKDNTMAAIARNGGGAPALTIYNRNGSTIGSVIPMTLPPPTEGGVGCAFSPEGDLVAALVSTPPYVRCWIKDSDSLPLPPAGMAPKDSYITFNDEQVFSWQHVNNSGTAQTGADLQFRRPEGTWQGLVTIAGDENSATIPANTFEAGSYQWRVRTYNQDGLPGEWSSPAPFVAVGIPTTPLMAGIEISSRPVINWLAGGQHGYHLQILRGGEIVWDSGETAGAIQACKVPIYLANGEYTARVRIINASMFWSDWAAQEFTTDVTGPAKSVLTGEAIPGAAMLTFSSPEKLYLLRNGVPIANVTGQTEYTDYAALGNAVYVLRAVDENDNYTDSDPVAVTVSVPLGMVATLAAVDDLAHPVALTLTRGGPRRVTGSKIRGATYHHYAGREFPVARYSGHSTEAHEISVAFLRPSDRDRLLALLDRCRTMLYRDNWGNRWHVTIPDNGYEQDRIATSLTLAMHATDYVEQIEYEV